MDIQERIRELQKVLHRKKSIVDGLKGNAAFEMLLEDYREVLKQADDNWHLLNLDDKSQLATFTQLRSIKLAGTQIINVVQSYEYDISRTSAEIEELISAEGEGNETTNSYMT